MVTREVNPDAAEGIASSIRAGVPRALGSETRIVVPLPGLLSISAVPPRLRRIPSTTASPKPRPVDLVLKKGSNILACVSGDIPQPVSEISNCTQLSLNQSFS